MRRRRFVALAACAGSAAIAGCGDASDDPESAATDRAEGQQQLGGRETATPGEDGTATERSASEETATEAETDTEEETPTETDSETPEETATETSTPEEESGAERRAFEYPEADVDVHDVEYDANSDEDAGPTVTGVVENVSGETLSYVEAKVEAFDGDDERVGDALADTTDLGDGETWEFTCELWDTDADEIEYWTGEVAVSREYEE